MSVQTPAGDSGLGAEADLAPADTVAAAEEVLRNRFGAPIRLADPQPLGGKTDSTVIRVRVADTPFSLPRTLVVKRYSCATSGGPEDGFPREAVSYQLFTAIAEDERICPELYAHDGQARVLVLEDLGLEPTLADKLLGDDPRAAESALLAFARSLGRLHATTAGREADFDALMRRFDRAPRLHPLYSDCSTALDGVPALLADALGVDTPSAVADVAERGSGMLHRGKHRAFSPAALCPDNNLITGRGVRFVDFAGGCVREILLDAAYLRVPFPACWCAFGLPPGMTEAMLAAWRSEVADVWPELDDDDKLLPWLLDAQLLWVWMATWSYLPRPGEHDTAVDATLPSPRRGEALLARWQRLADDADMLGVSAVAEHANAVVDGLFNRFGEELALPMFPAFAEPA
jgi:hypothetical protein